LPKVFGAVDHVRSGAGLILPNLGFE